MAIRFHCPSCQQPIEIDDQWAGQTVACPYCRRVVTAPTGSTWTGIEVPMASPSGPAFTPPPPPPGTPLPAPPRRSTAPLALALALLSGVLAFLAWTTLVMTPLMARLSANPTHAEVQQAERELMEEWRRGQVEFNSTAVATAAAGAVSGVAAFFLAIRALIRQERRKVMAVLACVLSALCSCFQLPVVLGRALRLSPGEVPATRPHTPDGHEPRY